MRYGCYGFGPDAGTYLPFCQCDVLRTIQASYIYDVMTGLNVIEVQVNTSLCGVTG